MNVGARFLIAAGGLMVGCASHAPTQQPVAQADVDARVVSHRVAYEEASATALVFDPPIANGERLPELSRDLREPSAFVGFDGPITTSYWIHTDDLQDSDWGGGGAVGRGSSGGDRYQRRAVIDKVGVSYR